MSNQQRTAAFKEGMEHATHLAASENDNPYQSGTPHDLEFIAGFRFHRKRMKLMTHRMLSLGAGILAVWPENRERALKMMIEHGKRSGEHFGTILLGILLEAEQAEIDRSGDEWIAVLAGFFQKFTGMEYQALRQETGWLQSRAYSLTQLVKQVMQRAESTTVKIEPLALRALIENAYKLDCTVFQIEQADPEAATRGGEPIQFPTQD